MFKINEPKSIYILSSCLWISLIAYLIVNSITISTYNSANDVNAYNKDFLNNIFSSTTQSLIFIIIFAVINVAIVFIGSISKNFSKKFLLYIDLPIFILCLIFFIFLVYELKDFS